MVGGEIGNLVPWGGVLPHCGWGVVVVEALWADLIVIGGAFDAQGRWRWGVVVVKGLWADLIVVGGGF